MMSMTHHVASHGRAVLAMLGRRVLRRPKRSAPVWFGGQDVMTTIESPSDALWVADALLKSVPQQHICDEFWQTAAVGPLTALLYAASLHGEEGGIDWVQRAVNNIYSDATSPRWYQANELCRSIPGPGAPALARELLRVAALSSRQRESICVMMRAAITAPGPA
jgi:hypothetical protein